MPAASRLMETKSFPFRLKEFSASTGRFIAYVSIYGNVDRDREIVDPGAFIKSIEEQRSSKDFNGFAVMRNHEWLIGISEGEDPHDQEGLPVEGRISTSQNVPKAVESLQLMEEKILNGWSFQYQIIRSQDDDDGIRHLTELAYYEGGPVDMPSNTSTYTVALKTVVPYQDLPLADLSRGWDSAAARKRVWIWAGGDWKKYRRAFIWYDDSEPEKRSSYKFFIADVIDGELQMVPRGIFVAASQISGPTDIPDPDVQQVKGHINRYYAKMGRESPFDKSGLGVYELMAGTAEAVEAAMKSGARLGPELIRHIEQTIDPLRALKSSPVAPSTDTRRAEEMSAVEHLKALQGAINSCIS